MRDQETEIAHSTLNRPQIHARWISDFYTTRESQLFHESAFDHIADLLGSCEKSRFLDAGCGDGAHTVRLAKRGFPVLALDLADHILDRARSNVTANHLAHMVEFRQGSLLNLPFPDASFKFVLCWGVLMHIPEIEKAIAELSRVITPNGLLIVSENNCWSLESLLVRIARRVLESAGVNRLTKRSFARLSMRNAGAEYWRQTESGPLICREARISWLIASVESCGFVLKERIAGELIERHASLPSKIARRCVQGLNLFWFRYVRLPQPAMGNLMVFQKHQ